MLRNLLPSVRRISEVPVRRAEDPFFAIQREMSDMLDDFWGTFDLRPFSDGGSLRAFSPIVDVREGDKDIRIKAELPGMDEKDIEVTLADDSITIKGEKREEKEERENECVYREAHYGAFHRMIPLPEGLDGDKAEASFKNGVLDVTVPRLDGAKRKTKKIEIKAH